MAEVISTKKNPGKAKPVKNNPGRGYRNYLLMLRKHLIRSSLAILLFAILAFMNRGFIFDTILLAPKGENFITNKALCWIGERWDIDNLCFNAGSLTIINVNMAGQFLTHLYVSVVAGVILAFPYILFEIWTMLAFFLNIKNRRTTIATITFGSILFMLGLLFSYFLIVPLTVNFLGTYFVSTDVKNTVMLGSYIGTIASLILGVGVFFELPVFIYFLAKYGIVSPAWLVKMRRIMIVVILIVSAIITPPDIISQIMVGIPLLLLYEVSIQVSKRVYPKS
ncbi:MAG: twin-arginine translocase subunit TatC [Bacteroidales bacterium]|nr:twin-arginine translocase subunit TatC [Bacteroidales bacterium]